ncbi:hypothetical protein ACFQ0P_00955 [Microbacterium insulae]|uniref:Nucleoside 2-deoxyribosyltransferase n=1 Tax=Microbacterium insulae TaxID=483014 RepID=A0ABW3ADW4_9MICO
MTDARPTCFIAMPITTHPEQAETYGDAEHWIHVMESLFIPAVTRAGFEPISPIAQGTDLIHAGIVKHLSTADLVLCDMSSHNPNVFFELGVRTAVNRPVALVCEVGTRLPFDISSLNTHSYRPTLNAWDTEAEVASLAAHITESAASSDNKNPLWRHFGLTIEATEPQPGVSRDEARDELMWESLHDIQRQLSELSSERTLRTPFGVDDVLSLDRASEHLVPSETRLRGQLLVNDIAKTVHRNVKPNWRVDDTGGLHLAVRFSASEHGVMAAMPVRDHDLRVVARRHSFELVGLSKNRDGVTGAQFAPHDQALGTTPME